MSFQTFAQTMQTIPITVAQQHGFFRKNGLNVSFTAGTTGPVMLAALAAGQLDAAGLPMFLGMQSVLAGVKAKALVGLDSGGGQVVFVSNRVPKTSAPYPASAKVLRGRTAAIAAPGGFTDKLFKRFIGGAGVSMNYVTLPGVAPEVAAMQAGRVDVVQSDLVTSYGLTKQGIGHIFWNFQTTGPSQLRGATTSDVWVSNAFLAQHPKASKGFARAIAQAVDWIKDPKNRGKVAKYFSAIAGINVPKTALPPMTAAMDAAVRPKDVKVYNSLIGGTLSTKAVLAPYMPQSEVAAVKLAEG